MDKPYSSLIVGSGKLGKRFYQYLCQSNPDDKIYTLSRSEKSWSKHHVTIDLLQEDLVLPSLINLKNVFIILAPDQRDVTSYRSVYIHAVTNLLRTLQFDHQAFHCTFISSTAVYGEHQLGLIDEQIQPCPNKYNGETLLEAEQNLTLLHHSVSIVRAAGLYSHSRVKLLNSLFDSEQYNNPKWLNLIHEQDLCIWIEYISQHKVPLSIASDGTPFLRSQLQDFKQNRTYQKSEPLRRFASNHKDLIGLQYPSIFNWLNNDSL
ncbi:MAG: hypothetical protein HWD86_07205 [Kangiellaceae bacterium]|nr:hypothetical protein [Kangiellaceae bacterium]